MASDDLSAAVEQAFFEQLSPYSRARIRAGEATTEECLDDEARRRAAREATPNTPHTQAMIDDAHAYLAAVAKMHDEDLPPVGTLVVRWCNTHGWERVGTITDQGFCPDTQE